ncbi:helix-turn-helix domain-containing protein [Paraliomyxa miuraensis]|uniref:helix-turn-helix domain-containing protein n=1 Tax=Paraliomyxa miuraensis TaxID=376150 RepID=UPI002254C278|nr:helix-turn-helix domain-containing protein [Paraliomyxa miuraensis]MCX4248045.1 hypothetical protein [Paraliomyxa miuraensis]
MKTDHADALAGVLGTTLHCIKAIVSCELASIYDLKQGRLEARSTVGSLASLLEMPQPIDLAHHPEIQQALDDGTPLRCSAQALLGGEAMPSHANAGLVIPLRCGNEALGALVLVGKAYSDADAAAATAAGHGLAAALTVARRLEEASPLGTTLLPLRKAERLHLLAALEHTSGKIYGRDGAARLLDLKPTTLQSKLKKHGINRLDVVEGVSSPTSSPTSNEDPTGGGRREPPIDVGSMPPTMGSGGSDPVASRAAE